MVGEPESGTIWWDLSGPGRLQGPRAPTSDVGQTVPGRQCRRPGPGLETPRPLLSSLSELIDDRL